MVHEEKNSAFGKLLKDYFSKLPKVGETVKGHVISVDKGAVRIDVGGVMVGIIRGKELFTSSNEYTDLLLGTEVEATVIEQENETGEMELSFLSAGYERVWGRMADYAKEGNIVNAKVLKANKGGLMMQVDALTAFMPVSQLSPEHYPRVPGGDKNRIFEVLKEYVGQTFRVKVINIQKEDQKLIVSEKAVWEDEQKAVLDSYKIGDIVTGEVGALTSFGAFIKFGDGLEGLVHISEIVWQRIDHPKDVLAVGDKVRAQIIDLNKSKIYLSIKRLIDDPWKSVKDTYTIGQVVTGEVLKIESFGLMVRLDDDIHGLAHISEISDSPLTDVKQIEEKFTIGKPYSFVIVSIEPAEHRLGLRLEGVKGKTAKKPTKADKPEAMDAEKETVSA